MKGQLEMPVYKCVVVGDGGTGKTTFIRRHLTGEFLKSYCATMGCEKDALVFHTNRGPIQFNVLDTSGQELSGVLRDAYYVDTNCAIIMFDVTSRITFKNVYNWHQDIGRVAKNCKFVLCGNKTDLKERRVKLSTIIANKRVKLEYYDISAKLQYNIEKPFLSFARQLLGDPALQFVPLAVALPAELKWNFEEECKMAQDLQAARRTSLPPDVD